RVAMRPADLAADPGWRPELGAAHDIRTRYWTTMPRSVLAERFVAFAGATDNPPGSVASDAALPSCAADDEVTACADCDPAAAERKLAAMRAYRTQIAPGDWLHILGERLGAASMGAEHYRLVKGPKGSGTGPHGWETDLFA